MRLAFNIIADYFSLKNFLFKFKSEFYLLLQMHLIYVSFQQIKENIFSFFPSHINNYIIWIKFALVYWEINYHVHQYICFVSTIQFPHCYHFFNKPKFILSLCEVGGKLLNLEKKLVQLFLFYLISYRDFWVAIKYFIKYMQINFINVIMISETNGRNQPDILVVL